MKKSFFLISVLSGLMLCSMALVSCGDDDPQPEIIESEVVDTGIAKDVTVKNVTEANGIEGTELTYESWIKVNSQTRASRSDVYTVLLKDVFHNTDTTIAIYDRYFDIGEYTTDISYYVKGTRRDGFVTITDSVMVYSINFEEFSFNYELEYEVAVYDDGITRETMPYHKIENIRDLGMEMVPLELVEDESLTVYARRQMNHSISVEFSGETYILKGKVILQVPFGTSFEPYVKKSELLGANYYTEGGQVYSSLRLKRYWSDGQVKNENIVVPVNVYIGDYIGNATFEGQLPESIGLVSYELGEVYESASPMYLLPYVSCGIDYRMFNINYGFIEFGIEVNHDTPYYYDGYLQYDFPVPSFTNFRFSEQEIALGQSGQSNGRNYTSYWLTRYMKVNFDKLEIESPITIGLVVYDE